MARAAIALGFLALVPCAAALVGCGARGPSDEGTSAQAATSSSPEAPPWASCSVGATVACTKVLPKDSPYASFVRSMNVTIASADGQHTWPKAFDEAAPLRAEWLPYVVTFHLELSGVGGDSSVTLSQTVAGPSDAPIVAKLPLALWGLRVRNPSGLDWSFTPKSQDAETRSIAPYVAGGNTATVSYLAPRLGDSQPNEWFPAPSTNAVPGTLFIAGESFLDPVVKVPTALDGPGVYTVTTRGLVLESRSFDDADGNAPDGGADGGDAAPPTR